VSSAFADLGFAVVAGPLFATPEETARQAAAEDVHVVGVSSLAAGHLTLVPELRRELQRQGRTDILIVVGGVVPEGDYEALEEAGAVLIVPPGTPIGRSAADLLDRLKAHLGQRQKPPEAYLPALGIPT
jgi:methylmalonyl-CoA mutase